MASPSAISSRLAEVQLESFEPRPPILGLAQEPLVTFREALEPIPLEEKELIADTAEIYCRKGGPLSTDEKQSIYAYSVEGASKEQSLYVMLNGSLRDRDRTKTKPFLRYVKLFNNALQKRMIRITQNLWRGVELDLYDVYINEIGNTIVFWGYTSTTIDMKALDQFIPKNAPKRTLFSIRTTAAADISEFSAFPQEKEMLIGAGTVFKVLNVHRLADNLTIIELEEVKNLLGITKPPSLTSDIGGLSLGSGSGASGTAGACTAASGTAPAAAKAVSKGDAKSEIEKQSQASKVLVSSSSVPSPAPVPFPWKEEGKDCLDFGSWTPDGVPEPVLEGFKGELAKYSALDKVKCQGKLIKLNYKEGRTYSDLDGQPDVLRCFHTVAFVLSANAGLVRLDLT